MSKKMRITAGAALAVFGVILAVFAYSGRAGKGLETYELRISGIEGESEESIFRVALDLGSMTYVQEAEAGGQTFTLDSGSFSADERGYQLYSETDDINSLYFVKDGEYIFPEQYLCQGEIPSGNVFEAVVSYESQGAEGEISFHDDGTYEERASDGEERMGSYKREGDLIHRTQENGGADLDLYVYGKKVTNSFYKLVK